jgi:hypothetical protein
MDLGDWYSNLDLSNLAPFERTQLKKEFDCFRVSYWNLFKLYIGILAVAQWLRFCATNRKVAGSIPDGVIGFLR